MICFVYILKTILIYTQIIACCKRPLDNNLMKST